jgi:GNAT superfamily N-acetyltransferase
VTPDRAVAAFWAAFIRNRNVDLASADDGAVSVAGGYALFVSGTYNQKALAVGSTRPLRADDLEVLQAFYGARKQPPRLELRDDTLERDRSLLEAAGYETLDERFGLYETLSIPEANSHIAVRSIDDRAAWVRLVTRAFPEGPDDDESRRSAAFCAAAAHAVFIAEVDGVPAGGGAVAILGEIAYLYCAGVLPQFRRRGIHHALIRARAAFGASRDATRTTIKVLEGSDAERSVIRAGFERTALLRRINAPLPR